MIVFSISNISQRLSNDKIGNSLSSLLLHFVLPPPTTPPCFLPNYLPHPFLSWTNWRLQTSLVLATPGAAIFAGAYNPALHGSVIGAGNGNGEGPGTGATPPPLSTEVCVCVCLRKIRINTRTWTGMAFFFSWDQMRFADEKKLPVIIRSAFL